MTPHFRGSTTPIGLRLSSRNFPLKKKCKKIVLRISDYTKLQPGRLFSTQLRRNEGRNKMSHIDYALYESPVGYALFQVVHQADAVGLKLKETQAAVNDLAKFGKMVKLVNFSPFR